MRDEELKEESQPRTRTGTWVQTRGIEDDSDEQDQDSNDDQKQESKDSSQKLEDNL